jgi:hypothetical protein
MEVHKFFRCLFLFFLIPAFGQPEADFAVVQALIDHELDKGEVGMRLSCQQANTVFDMETFSVETDLKIPQESLYSLAIRALKSTSKIWDTNHLEGVNESLQGLINSECLSEKSILKLFRKSGKRQNILLISTPVYDISQQYCIVQVVHQKFTKSSYGQSCMLKRKGNEWEIIAEFDFWMS